MCQEGHACRRSRYIISVKAGLINSLSFESIGEPKFTFLWPLKKDKCPRPVETVVVLRDKKVDGHISIDQARNLMDVFSDLKNPWIKFKMQLWKHLP